ncbi:MAG: LysR family transcriptional regulator [Luteolibacter sp.]
MELRQLRHFVEICEQGSISAAARKLRLSQPALSRQIKALEETFDTPLFERGAHSIQLTSAGELLLGESRKLLKFCDGMVEKVRTAAHGDPLRVGYAPSLAGEFLSVAIGRFTQFHPRVRVSLFDWSSIEMHQGLTQGKLDLVVGAPCPRPNDSIHWEPLWSYGWRVIVSSQHPFATKVRISPEDLAGQKLLLYDREHYPDYWDRITGFFGSRQLQAKIAGEFDGINSLLAALAGNLGVAILSESTEMERCYRQALVSLKMDDQPARIEVAAGYLDNDKVRPQVQAFIEELKRATSEE